MRVGFHRNQPSRQHIPGQGRRVKSGGRLQGVQVKNSLRGEILCLQASDGLPAALCGHPHLHGLNGGVIDEPDDRSGFRGYDSNVVRCHMKTLHVKCTVNTQHNILSCSLLSGTRASVLRCKQVRRDLLEYLRPSKISPCPLVQIVLIITLTGKLQIFIISNSC